MGWGAKLPEKVIYVCNGSKCSKRGGKQLAKSLKKSLKARGLNKEVQVIITECTDRCKLAPVISVQPENKWYLETREEQTEEILQEISEKQNKEE